MGEWFLILQLWLADVRGPEVYVPAGSQAACREMGRRAVIGLETDREGTPVFRLTWRCVRVKGA